MLITFLNFYWISFLLFFSICSYISALSDDQEQPDLLKTVSSGWPASLHLIGKVCHRFSYFFSKLNLLKTIFYLLITSSLFITINCEDPLHKSPNVSLFHPNLSFYSSFTNLFVCVWERLHKLFQLTRGCLTMRCFFSAWFISLESNRIIKLETFDLWFCSLYLF